MKPMAAKAMAANAPSSRAPTVPRATGSVSRACARASRLTICWAANGCLVNVTASGAACAASTCNHHSDVLPMSCVWSRRCRSIVGSSTTTNGVAGSSGGNSGATPTMSSDTSIPPLVETGTRSPTREPVRSRKAWLTTAAMGAPAVSGANQIAVVT